MPSQTKTQLLNDIYNLLRKRYKLEPRDGKLPVLESIIFAICNEGATHEEANQALSRFKDHFFDWNEVRVSTLQEIEDVLAGLPEPANRAIQIRRFLRQLFEKTYGFSLDALLKKPMKDALKALSEYDILQSDYVHATVVHTALGGHAIPVDALMRRALERLGVEEAGIDDASLRSLLERAIPKNRGSEFADLLEKLSHDTCTDRPDCPRCELRKICPTGRMRIAAQRKGVRSAHAPTASKATATEAHPARKSEAKRHPPSHKDPTPRSGKSSKKKRPG